MKKIIVFLAMMVILCGCTVKGNTVSIWEKEGVTPEQERLDMTDCEFQAKAHTEDALYREDVATERYRELRDMCFKSKGYVLISREFQQAE